MNKGRIALVLVVAAAVAAYFFLDLGRYASLDFVKAQHEALDAAYRARPVAVAALFFAAYVGVAALSLPGAAIMTLAAGAIFGFLWGTVIVSFASSIGATLAFLAARFLFRDAVQSRFGNRLAAVNSGIEREGGFYLFTLRLVPIFPFFFVNLAMALTPLPVRTFYWVSQVGMFAGTMAYVYAGTQIARIDSLRSVISPGMLAALALLGVLPLAAKRSAAWLAARKVYARWPRPRRYDRNLVVIGGGSAGLVTAYIAAAVKAKVTLVEQDRMGGDCLYTGCVPSKALIRSTRFIAQARRSGDLGIASAKLDYRYGDIMARVQRVIRAIEPHDSPERYAELGVDCVAGRATITSPWTVEIAKRDGSTQTVTTRAIVIAAGARPSVPPIPGLDRIDYLTSENLWSLAELPARLVVLGGGPIGCELAQCFARLGSRVTQVEMLDRLLAREDPDVSALVAARFASEGIEVMTGARATACVVEDSEHVLRVERNGTKVAIPFDRILVAVGRAPNTAGYGLDTLGIPVTARGTIEVNEYLQTRYPNIYACGDVAGPYQFTHTASHTAWYAAVNALFGRFRRFKADYSVIPWATFTEPEVARVGLNETEAKEKGIAYELSTYRLDDLDRAIADGTAEGFVKVLTVPGKDRILGATIVGEHAGDLIIEFITAMKHGIGLNRILGTIHVYPTLVEANKYAAGVWKRAHAPRGVLAWVARYHAWQLG